MDLYHTASLFCVIGAQESTRQSQPERQGLQARGALTTYPVLPGSLRRTPAHSSTAIMLVQHTHSRLKHGKVASVACILPTPNAEVISSVSLFLT